MYIAWKNTDNTDSLFKVQLDSDFNYVSHEVLGELKFDTFGLASEQGFYMGYCPEIYRIVLDTSTPTFETVLSTTLVTGHGSGQQALAKLSKLLLRNISETDAQNNSNALSNPWTNTVEDSETIYVRTENITTGNFIVTPVNIEIYPTLSLKIILPIFHLVILIMTVLCHLISPSIDPNNGTQDTSLYEVNFIMIST